MTTQNEALLLASFNKLTYLGRYEAQTGDDTLELKDSFISDKKTMDALTQGYMVLDSKKLTHVFYARGPGSLTALKLIFIFAHTLAISRGLEVRAADSFSLNDGAPIHAFKDSYFVKSGDEVVLSKGLESTFTLPERVCKNLFTAPLNSPLYGLSAL